MTVKTEKLDLNSETIVESIIKRKNGTQIFFGHGHHRRIEYNFQPIDPSSKESPHVCDVRDDNHRHQLLAISEGFRLYNQPEDAPDYDDDQDDPEDDPNTELEDDYEDMLGLNADQVSTDFLKAYAKNHLKISSTSKAAVQEYAKANYNLDLEGTMTVINMLRAVMKAEQAMQAKASEAARLANT